MQKKRTVIQHSHRIFVKHLARNVLISATFIFITLIIGMWGYHFFEAMSGVDAFVNASMILSGMGPLSPLKTVSGKIFAGCYALFSGLLFVLILGLLLAPLFHRLFLKIKIDSS